MLDEPIIIVIGEASSEDVIFQRLLYLSGESLSPSTLLLAAEASIFILMACNESHLFKIKTRCNFSKFTSLAIPLSLISSPVRTITSSVTSASPMNHLCSSAP